VLRLYFAIGLICFFLQFRLRLSSRELLVQLGQAHGLLKLIGDAGLHHPAIIWSCLSVCVVSHVNLFGD